ncbi:MAG: hypothetical protein QF713_01580, partial [Dehalococcoidales bacterium]|nr:hypothetical protein [Dehalococcoidales bacterium]
AVGRASAWGPACYIHTSKEGRAVLLAPGVEAGMLTDTAGYVGIWFVPAYWITWSLKRRLTQPRIWFVKVARERKTLSWLAIAGVATFIIAVVAYFLVVSGSALAPIRGYFMFLFGAIIVGMAGAMAYWWLAKRWYAYAVLILLGVAAYQWLDFSLPFSFIIPGSVIILSGLVTLVRFLRKTPNK